MARGYGYRERPAGAAVQAGRIADAPRLEQREQARGMVPVADAALVAGTPASEIRDGASGGSEANANLEALVDAGFLSTDEAKILGVYDNEALAIVTGAIARVGQRLYDVADPLKLIASEVIRSGGDTTQLQAIVQQLANTGHAASGMQESGGKAINRLLAKSLAGDADSLDGVANGTTYARALATALTSGQVDLAKAGVVGKHAANIARSSGDTTALATILQYLANTGHLAGSMQESGGRAVNRLLAKALAGDADSMDGLADGATYFRTTSTEKVGGSRAASIINASLRLIANLGTEGDFYIPGAGVPKVGYNGSPSYLTKTLRISARSLSVLSGTIVRSTGAITPDSASVDDLLTVHGVIPLPLGVTITSFRARVYAGTANGVPMVTVTLKRATDANAESTLATLTAARNNTWATKTAALSETAQTGYTYYVEATLENDTTAGQAMLLYVEVEYTMPSYDKGI